MFLGSPFGFYSFGHLYFHRHLKVALSAYLHCCQPPTCPWNHCWCFCSLVPPCTADWSLTGRGLCGCFLGSLIMPAALWRLVCSSFSSPGLPSAPPGLCALERFVCFASLSTQACPLCCGVSMGFSQSSEPADWSGLHSVSCLRAENCGFLCFLPSKSLLCPVFWDSAASPSACLQGSFYGHGNSSCFRTLSLPWGRSSHPEVSVCSLFMSPSSLLLHCLCPWRSGVFCCHPEVALEKFFHILMSFWCICGEADNLPSYYSAFFCSLLSIVNFRS